MSRRQSKTPEQLDLEYRDRRKLELQQLKAIRLGDPSLRLILFVLDSFINHKLQYWDMSHDELIEATEMARSTYYEKLSRLKELCLISVEDINGSAKKRFRIIRSNVAWHQGQMRSKARRRQSNNRSAFSGVNQVHQECQSVQQVDTTVRQLDKPVQPLDRSVQQVDTTVQQLDCTILPSHTVPYRPTTATIPKAAVAVDEIVLGMIALGVEHPLPAIDRAISRGASPGELLEVLEHFRTLAPVHGFKAGALHRRVSNHFPGMPVDSGWPARKQVKPAATAVHNAGQRELDAMSERDLRALIQRSGSATMRQLCDLGGVRALRESEQWKPYLIKLLEQQEVPA